jgi:RNA polymerase sigma-70 factor (ECF subfamily)
MRELRRLDERDEPWDDNVEEFIDPTVDLDAELVNAESRREIRLVFAALPERDRKILQALYVDEIPKAEVCRMFNVDAAYLRVLLHRAKAQFRKLYRGDRGNGHGTGAPPVNPNGA